MLNRFAVAAAALWLPLTPVIAQQAAPVSPAPPEAQGAAPIIPDKTELAHVAIVTGLGTIVVALDMTHAPVTSANFLRYAKAKRFDGTNFYRVMRLDWGTQPNGLIQGGTRADPKRDFPPIAHEPTSETGIRHVPGTISMARFEPGSARGDFTIMVSDMTGLDADPASADADRRAGFAAFGNVVSGMDVARAIFDAPISPTEGEGFLRGQMIARPVPIVSVRSVPAPPAATATVRDEAGAGAPISLAPPAAPSAADRD